MLRPYQVSAVKNVYQSMKQHDRTMLQLPTGSGKTHVAMEIIKHGLRHGRRINFCVDRIVLADQTIDRFYEEGIEIGVVQGQHALTRPQAPVQIVSLQTLQRRKPENWPAADLFIVDEAHTQYAITKKVMDRWNNIKYLGLSATPFTRGLGLVWNDLVVGVTTRELIEMGFLCDYVAYGPSSPDLTGVRRSGGDYNAGQLEERMNVLTGNIVQHWMSFAKGKKTLAFTPTVAYAQHLADEFRRNGVEADYVCGHDTEERRNEVMGRYKAGEIEVMTNCEVLTKGLDIPEIECGILARPTRSLSLHIQMCGRLLRTHDTKDRALILDHASNIERLGFPDDQLPSHLDREIRGEPSDTRAQDEPQPWNCPQCHSLVPPRTRQCPACGFIARAQPDVEVLPGVLQQMKRGGVDPSKQTVYSQLLSVAREHNYKRGWVANKYRKLFDVWPRGMLDVPAPPTEALRDWLADERRRFLASKNIRENYNRRNA